MGRGCLEVLVAILDPLSEALDAIAAIYPPLEDTADAVNGFIATLDSVQILTRAIEFGLKVHCLDTFGNQVEPLYLEIFPESASNSGNEPPTVQNVGICDVDCQASAPVQVSGGQMDCIFNYTRAVRLLNYQ